MVKPASTKPDPVKQYALDVVEGRIVAGKLVRLACQRHLDDLVEGPARGLRWDLAAGLVAIDFFSLLKHSKGKWAGQTFELSPWQQFAVGSIFGWKRADGFRRFRVAHIEVARKNGKSTLAAGIALYLLTLDGESGAEVYCVATKKDQAKLTFEEAERMVKGSPALRKRVQSHKNNLSVIASNSKLEPLGADGDTLDGLNVHGAIKDELQAWKTRGLWDVIETATGARDQPLTLVTTTAGYNRNSIWWERRELVIKVVTGVFQDDDLFGLIYTLDDEDDWTDEKNWSKGNPNLGTTVKAEEIKKKVEEAKQTPGKQNAVRRLRLNQPTEQADRWIELELWDACADPIDEEELHGRPCFGGLDLSQTIDVAAWVLLFPPTDEDERWRFLVRLWVPADNIRKRVERDRVPYDVWKQEGLIETTPGNSISYAHIKDQVLKDAATFQVREVAFDRMFAIGIIQELMEEGMECVAFGQGFYSMAAPTKELERLIVSRELAHDNSPVMRWMAGNVAVEQDPAGNLKPSKRKSTEKIDGIAALIMALGRAIVKPADETSSYYDTHEVEMI